MSIYRMSLANWTLPTLAFLVCSLSGCRQPSALDASGAYTFNYQDGSEVRLILLTNGAYQRTWTHADRTALTSTGRWSFDANQCLVVFDQNLQIGTFVFDKSEARDRLLQTNLPHVRKVETTATINGRNVPLNLALEVFHRRTVE
jgi:hypothetical protein